MYTLEVFHGGALVPTESHLVRSAADVLAMIPKLLEKHAGCERIAVSAGVARLFVVDCAGNRVPD